jgi:hypothetical protein
MRHYEKATPLPQLLLHRVAQVADEMKPIRDFACRTDLNS